MAQFDMPLKELELYKPPREEPEDFDHFWSKTLEQTRRHPLNAKLTPVDYGINVLDIYDLSFNGYGGQLIKAWFMLPKNADKKLPCVVEYIGYGGGRSFPYQWLTFPSAGYAYLVMDTRGQGSVWSHGDTPDQDDSISSPQVPGFMTRGVLSPESYYYRRLITDAVRAVEAARNHPLVDASKVVATGGSQGGGLTLAVAGLDANIAAAMPDVPFLCHYRRAAMITDSHPYNEIVTFCQTHRDKVETVFNTLSYFDGLNFAARAKSRALFSVGLRDDVCPPSTIYAAYNHYAADKEICVYEYNSHEGGSLHQRQKQIAFLKQLFS
jgi:cephalosporin-C deacetylase